MENTKLKLLGVRLRKFFKIDLSLLITDKSENFSLLAELIEKLLAKSDTRFIVDSDYTRFMIENKKDDITIKILGRDCIVNGCLLKLEIHEDTGLSKLINRIMSDQLTRIHLEEVLENKEIVNNLIKKLK